MPSGRPNGLPARPPIPPSARPSVCPLRPRALVPALALAALALTASGAGAQNVNPVYVDDSAAAADTLSRAPQLAASGNTPEAARALQRLLEEEPDRVAPQGVADPDLFTSVRLRVHQVLLGDPELLAEYRRLMEARPAELLAAGQV